MFSVMAPTNAKKILWLHSLPSFPPALSTECIYVSKTEVRSNTVNSLLTDTSIRWTPFLKWTPKVCACLSLLPLFTLHNMDLSVRLRLLAVPKVSVIEVVSKMVVCKMVQIPSVCEAGSADVVDEDEWSFLPAFQKKEKRRKRFLHLHL